MGTVTVLLKLAVSVVVLVTSFIVVALILQLATVGSPAASANSVVEDLGALLTVFTCAFVGILFTIPALLSMFGHAGAWVSQVAVRVWKHLSLALLAGAALYAGANETTIVLSNPASLTVAQAAALTALAIAAALASLWSFGPEAAACFGSAPRRLLRLRSRTAATVELMQSPIDRVRQGIGAEDAEKEMLRMQGLARTLGTLDGATELVVGFRDGRGRSLFVATGRSDKWEMEQRLVSVLRAYLHGHQAEPCQSGIPAARGGYSHTVGITGVPEPAEDPLEPLARFFLESGHEGEYRVRMCRAMSDPVRRLLASRRQRALSRKAGHQISEPEHVAFGTREKSTRVVDHLAEVEHEEAVRESERRASRQAVRVRVSVTGYGSTQEEARRVAVGGAATLRGMLSSHRNASALRVKPVRDAEVSPSSVLIPAEAAPYFWIPRVAMGGELAPTAEFELSQEMEGEIELGDVVLQSGATTHGARIPLDSLSKHLFVTGMTGSGKTTSCLNLLTQLHQLGIPFLVVEPVKNEYRALLARIPGLQVFTLGDEETTPFRLNIFEPPAGVRVQTHLEHLQAAWNSSFVMYAPLPLVLGQVLEETYRACGWDVRKEKRGRPISLEDFRVRAEVVCRRLGYEPKVSMDIEAALKTRIASLSMGGKGPMFDTMASIPFDDLLRRPTVLELKGIANSEEKAFVAALILTELAEYVEAKGASKQLRHVTLVEEAHRLLPNVSTQKGDPEAADPRRHTVEQFANMLAEFRALGEGLVVVEQIPTKIIPDAIKNTATKLAHRVPAADDREVLAGAMNMTEEQSRVLAALRPGEAILGVERHQFPIRILSRDEVARTGLPVGEVPDDEVMRRMTPFYLRNPLPRAPPATLNLEVSALVDSEWFKAKFLASYREWLEKGNPEPLCDLLVRSAKTHSKGEEDPLEVASKILPLAVACYLALDERDREKFPRVFMQKVRRWERANGTARG